MSTRAKIEQQIENLLVAQVMMQSLRPERFVNGLALWSEFNGTTWSDVATEKQLVENRCGAAACFGGWVAVEPHFQKQGVTRNIEGAPVMRGMCWSSDVAKKLFGEETLFDSMRYEEEFVHRYTEKEAVLKRIEHALEDRLDELK